MRSFERASALRCDQVNTCLQVTVAMPSSEFSYVRLKKIVCSVEEMDEADEELRQTLKKIWPLKAKKNMIDLVVPPNHGMFPTVLVPRSDQ